MAHASDNWIRVSRQSPCPLCGKPDNCTVSLDGAFVWCGRVSEGSIRENHGGQFLHRLSDSRVTSPPYPARSATKRSNNKSDFSAQAAHFERIGAERIPQLASELGIPVEGLLRIHTGWSENESFWSFPERDADGKIIGINKRLPDGSKRRVAGGRSGLTYADEWDNGSGPILLVEGASDTASLLSIGLNVIGRPSNLGGVAFLTQMLADFPADRAIIVVGERDEKPDGKWPGRDGATRTAGKLAAALGRTVQWSFPPDGAKDARAWLQLNQSLTTKTAAEEFLRGLVLTEVLPPPRIVIPSDDRPLATLADWRSKMLRARLDSVGHPGFYLDTSTTGTGKSFVDIEVIVNTIKGNVA